MKTNAIPNPIDGDQRPSWGSVAVRSLFGRIALLVLSQIAVVAAYIIAAPRFALSSDIKTVSIAFVVMQVAWIGGQVISTLPRGHEWAEARLYLSTGIRSGFPLLMMLLLDLYVYPDLLPGGLAILILLYGFGFVLSVVLITGTSNQV